MRAGTSAQGDAPACVPTPSLKRNVIANYASQFYTVLAGIALVPVYLRLMGSEVYGLVGFYAMLQSWLWLLDPGLTATVSRETARYRGGAYSVLQLRELLRSMEGIFWVLAAAAAALLIVGAPQIAARWLNAATLSNEALSTSLALMAIAVACRWLTGLYRGVLAGLERQVWLGAFNVAANTARFIGVLGPLLWIAPTPIVFFGHQALISVIEVVVIIAACYRFLPLPAHQRIKWSLAPFKATLKFSGAVALSSASWVLVTQMDKLVMSKLLPLADYGLFSAAVLVASGINLVGGPLAQALLPRMTRLSQIGDDIEVLVLYRRATQIVAAACGTAALVLAVFAQEVLWLWTNDKSFATRYATVLTLYALGNAALALNSFAYYLQFARGRLRLHVIGSLLFVVTLVPGILLLVPRFGALAAGGLWLGVNVGFLLLWVPVVHRRFAPGLHWKWLGRDVASVLAAPVLIAMLAHWLTATDLSRIGALAHIVGFGVVMLGSALYRCELVGPKAHGLVRRLLAAR